MIFGLTTAVAWGLSDLLAAVVGRRIGSFRTLIIAQVTGLVLCLAWWVAARPPIGRLDAGAVAALAAAGALAAAAYVALYRGLELGPVALVSPIVSAYAAGPVILAVVVLHEHLSALGAGGAATTLAGAVLACTNPHALRSGRPRARTGIPHAILAMAGFAIGAFVIAAFARPLGWFAPVALSRTAGLVTLASAPLIVPRLTAARADSPSRGALLLAAAVGALDIGGVAIFARASQLGLVALVAAVSATFPLIPVLGGVALFGERLARSQVVGVALVIGGLVLLGVTG